MQHTEIPDDNEDDRILRALKTFDNYQKGSIFNYEYRFILTQIGEILSEKEVQLFSSRM